MAADGARALTWRWGWSRCRLWVVQNHNLTYQITVTNNGPDAAHGVAINQTLPASATFVSAVSSQGSVSVSGNTLIGTLGTVNLDATASMTVVVIPNVAGTITLSATVGSSETDFNPGNNTVTLATQVTPPTADLAVTISASPDPVSLGGILTYTTFITNNGPVAAINTLVTNTLPPNVTFVSVQVSQGSAVVNGTNVISSLGTLGPGAPAEVTIGVRAIVPGGITATASVGSSVLDAVPGNNTASVTSTIVPASDLNLTMSGPGASVLGSNVSYTLTVINLGPSAASGVTINDVLPPGATFVNATKPYTQSGNLVTWTVSNLPVGSSVMLTNVIGTSSFPTNPVPFYITNSATVASGSADPNPANNAASVVTRVDVARPAVVPAGAALLTEGFVPPNGFVNPGETVTVALTLQNIGNLGTSNLVATLLSTNGVTPVGTSVLSYGALSPGGGLGTNAFSFTASGMGVAAVATLQLQDGANNLGVVQFPFPYPAFSIFTNSGDIVIPDHGRATPYPASIAVSGVAGLIGKVTVTLTNVNHTYPDDVDMLLVAPAGQSVLLMSHAGGGNVVTNVSLSFDDMAASQLPASGQITSGTYQPSGYQVSSVDFPNSIPPAVSPPSAPYGGALSLLNGTNANGNWSLFVFDSSPGDQGIILGGWSLAIAAGTPVNQGGDVAITGTAVPSPVAALSNLTYVFSITNNGPNTANGVAFTNILPAGVNVVSANSTQGAPVINGGTVTCLLGNLGVGTNVTITIQTVPTIPGVITNRATAFPLNGDLYLANNTATVITTVSAPLADLGVSVSSSPAPAVISNNLVYTMVVSNNGPGTALAVVLTSTLNGVVTNASSPPFIVSSGEATAQLGNLQPGSVTTVTLNVTPNLLGSFTNIVTASTLSSDPNPANNSASGIITVLNPAPNIVPAGAQLLTGNFLPPDGTIHSGETVTLALGLTNAGSASTSNLTATLLSTNGVTSLSNPQTYGALVPGGSSAFKSFSLTASGPNGGIVGVTLALQDGASNLGNATFNFNLPASSNFVNAFAIVIPDHGAATPYPSTIGVSGLTGVVGNVTATLSNFSHSFPNDVQALLVGPAGQKTVLMAGTGGPYSVTNATLTFDDAAASSLPASGQIVTGIFKPTDDLALPLFPSPAPTGPYATNLGAFHGSAPNGTWSLYVFDNSPGDSGVINGGWSLNITTVELLPSPASLAAVGKANGTFTLMLSGVPGQTYVIEASTDLINWAPVATNTAVGGTFEYTDSNATSYPSRFFRARPAP